MMYNMHIFYIICVQTLLFAFIGIIGVQCTFISMHLFFLYDRLTQAATNYASLPA